MGYTMITMLDGKEYRYTEWVDYGTLKKYTPDFERNVVSPVLFIGSII